MLICECSISLLVLLADKKKESLQKGIIVIDLSIIYLPFINMHPIQHYLKAGLNICILL